MDAIAKQTSDGIAQEIRKVIAKLSAGVMLAMAVSSCTMVSGSEPDLKNFGIRQTVMAQGLNRPWGMAWLSERDLLITERDGTLKRLRWNHLPSGSLIYGDRIISGAVIPKTDGDAAPPDLSELDTDHLEAPKVEVIPGIPQVFASGQGGLMDIALHPEFTTNQLVYFTYSDGTSSANRTQIARAKFDGKTITQWQPIFANADSKSGSQHFGARLAWLPDGTLLVSLGDGGNPPVSFNGALIRHQAQNLGTHFGKVIRINDDGSVPADNPFVNQPGAKPEIWSYGHRNIQGLAVDAKTGQVWATEHGSRGGDELNRLEAGGNFGWPEVSFSQEYSGDRPVAPATSKPGMIDPLTQWTPAIAPSGLAVYRGEAIPSWQGNLFVGALRAQEVIRYQVDEPGLVGEVIPFDQRVRDVKEGPDGLIYVLTDDENGQLIRLAPESR
jgi:aldose sugar dehydrogenase